MARIITIEVRVEEIERLDPAYMYDPKIQYELTPVDDDLDGEIEFVCKRSHLGSVLARLDRGSRAGGASSKAIYGEPEEDVGDLLRDAADKALSGFSIPAISAIVDSVEEAVMPERVRLRRKVHNKERE